MTEIDSLQITIESNSKSAAQGIGELAGALENLKKNGAVSVAVKNLKSLATELRDFPDNSQAGRALGRVAGALREIKAVGSVKSAADSLSKLGGALRSLDTVKVDSAKITSIANALGVLSNVKAGGINTMMNGLLKIGKATESLNDKAIADFAERVDKLLEKLTPLSAKMTTIQSGFKAINSNARSAGSSIREMGEEVDGASVNLSSFIYTIQSAVDWLQQAIQKFSEFIAQAVEWDGISARFGRTFGEQAEETYGWIQRLNEEMGLNVQQFMQYSSLYAQMLTGFGVASEDAKNMAVGYTELTYDIWASANDRYKTFEDAADAVASAIAGEVEPIRRAGFTIVESTLAETAAYHGLDISIANATESQKSYLRYLTLVDQAHATGTIGVYAKELNTAEGMMRTFSQQLKSLTQAFGSLFIPVLVKVMPYLQAFVELLAEGVRWVAGLFGIEIQAVDFSGYKDGADAIEKVTGSAADAEDALGSATKAAKELKNATLGVDELNVISPPSATGGTGGGGTGGTGAGAGIDGLDISSLWDESIFDNIQSDVDAIRKKMKKWMPLVASLAAGFAGLRLAKLVTDINKTIKGFKKIANVSGAVKWIKEFFKAAKQMAPEVGWMKALFPKLSGWFVSIGTAVSGAASGVGSFVAGISAPVWGTIGAIIVAIGSAAYFLYENWEEVTRAVKNFFDENIVPKLDSIRDSWEKMKDAIADILPPGVIQWFKDVGEWIMNAVDAVKEWVASGEWLKGLATVFEWIGGIVFTYIGGQVAGAFQAVITVIDGFVQTVSGIVQIVSGVVSAVVAVFKGDWQGVLQAVKDTGQGIFDVFNGLYTMIVRPISEFVNGVIGFFVNLWDELVGHSIVPDTINAIVEWFTSLPGRIFESISNFVGGVIDYFSGLWSELTGHIVPNTINSVSDWFASLPGRVSASVSNFVAGVIDGFTNLGTRITEKFSNAWATVKSWWSAKGDLSTYTPNIGSIKDKLSSAWTTAKTWWDNTKKAMSSYTPNIGSIYEKVKDRWDNAREWWNNSKAKMKEYTPSIGSIYEKAKERWDNARNWWNDKKTKMKEYTPSIGSIYEKLRDRWASARDWWNNTKSGLASYTPSIGSIKSKLSDAWADAKKWWSNNVKLSIPSLSFKVTYVTKGLSKTKQAIVDALNLDGWPTLKFAANGGVFGQGSLVWAGERGPEIVANAAGGKTGVMNVQQMSDAMYEAVYAAVVTANRASSGGGAQAVNVYLDGKQIYSSVKKTEAERGVTLMGNQLGYTY